jgi:hypothetical protein
VQRSDPDAFMQDERHHVARPGAKRDTNTDLGGPL